MSITVFIILLVIAIPVGLYIGRITDKRQGKNKEEWKEHKRKQEKLEELEELLKEIKGEE